MPLVPSRRVRLSAALCGIGILMVGCNPDGAADRSGIRGTALITAPSLQAGEPAAVQSWQGRVIEAWVPSGSGYQTFVGLVDSAGEFRIDQVPPGPYWLVFPDEVTAIAGQAKVYVWTEARELDLGYQKQAPLEYPRETLPFGAVLTGLSPVQADDWVEVAPASGLCLLTERPRPLGTEQAGVRPLLDLCRVRPREPIVVRQWRERPSGPLTAATIVKAGAAEFPAAPGAPVPITLTDPPERQLDLRVEHAGFLRQLGLTAPSGTSTNVYFDLMLLTSADPTGAVQGRPEVALRLSGRVSETEGPSASGIRYGDPHPAGWARRYELRYSASHPCSGQASGSTCGGSLVARGPLSELAAGTVQPRVSRPQGLQLDGKDATAPDTEVGPDPTLRWQAPTSGPVSAYLLSLIRLVTDPDGSTREEAAGLFITPRTELTLLPGVLQPGGRYLFKLRALSGLDLDATTAPRRASLRQPPDETWLWSAAFRVAP